MIEIFAEITNQWETVNKNLITTLIKINYMKKKNISQDTFGKIQIIIDSYIV